MLEESNPPSSNASNPENNPSSTSITKDEEQPTTFENIPSMSVAMQPKTDIDEKFHQEGDANININTNNDNEKQIEQQTELEDESGDDLFF